MFKSLTQCADVWNQAPQSVRQLLAAADPDTAVLGSGVQIPPFPGLVTCSIEAATEAGAVLTIFQMQQTDGQIVWHPQDQQYPCFGAAVNSLEPTNVIVNSADIVTVNPKPPPPRWPRGPPRAATAMIQPR